MANECVPYYIPGEAITGKATAAITGMRFTAIDPAGPHWVPEGLKSTAIPNVVPVEPCGAGIKPFGVAQRDKASGGLVGNFRYGVVPVTAGAAVEPGDEVESDATGRAITLSTGVSAGTAMSRATAAGQVIAVALSL